MKQIVLALAALLVAAGGAWPQQPNGTLKGQITDPSGSSIPGAVVALQGPGAQRSATTDETGAYSITGLAPGKYTVHASATGFTAAENSVEVRPSAASTLNFNLAVALERQQVTVQAEGAPAVSTEASSNAGQLVLRGEDLDALPDDPDDLAADLQALAGPSAGPNGGQIFIDGFSNARLPPKASIREIRINQNPFSAEYDRLGFGRIEILTKPGSDKFRGMAFLDAGDRIFNSRNPFVTNRPDFQQRQYGGNFSGPLSKKASFFLDAERREIDDNAAIDATVLDPTTLMPTQLQQAVLTPQRRTTVSPRIDYQLTPKNTLVMRYSYTEIGRDNAGIGDFSLLSRAYNTTHSEQTVQVTETSMLSAKAINETRLQFARNVMDSIGDNSLPAINVLQAFNGGGAQIGNSRTYENRWEVQNYTSLALGAHAVKAGFRLRSDSVNDASPQNFGGTFTFSGGLAPQLDANNQPLLDSNGSPVLAPITSLERYRRTLLLQSLGMAAAQIRQLGGGASQFSIAAGTPVANVSQVDIGPFFQDDWRMRSNFTLSLGLRYETQTNIHDWRDIAPRLGFAWAPGGSARKNGKTVLRGGFGMFYDRVDDNLTLQAIRFNGINQQQFIVSNPDFYPAVPALATLSATLAPMTIRELSSTLRAPYVMQSAIGIERQLTSTTTIASTFTWSHADHLLRTRNINAPMPGTELRPYGSNNLFLYESTGVLSQRQWITNLNSRVSRNASIFAFYVLNKAMSNTDGVNTLPANSYDLSTEWSRSSLDVRHRFVLGGSLAGPRGVRLSPFLTAQSGPPFNITTGADPSGDGVFTERPALTTDLSKPGVVVTRFGAFDPNPAPGQPLIPRNFGQGPGFYALNLRLSKTWGFGSSRSAAAPGGGFGDGGPRGGGMRGGGGGPRGGPMGGGMRMGGGGMRGMFGGETTEKRYNLTFSASARNVMNHTNPGPLSGNLTSPLFGQSNTLNGGFGPASGAGNRRVELQLRFAF